MFILYMISPEPDEIYMKSCIFESSREIEKSQPTIFFPYLFLFGTLFETLVLRAPEVSGAVLWICWGEGVGLLGF